MVIKVKYMKLSEVMYRNGTTQRSLARSSNLGLATVHQICRGKRIPSAPTAKKICDALKVEFDEIFEIVRTEVKEVNTIEPTTNSNSKDCC